MHEVKYNLSKSVEFTAQKKGVTINNTRSKTKRNASLIKPKTKI